LYFALSPVIDKLLTDFDLEQFLGYELGTIKPEAQIYKSILNRFNREPRQFLFVGDTFEADYAGPIAWAWLTLGR
jgi:HAD superfamily hydrolase (TIGR01549 family)